MESEMVTVKYDDLSTAFDFVSFAGLMEHRAYVSLDTGAISLDWRSRGLLSFVSFAGPMEHRAIPDAELPAPNSRIRRIRTFRQPGITAIAAPTTPRRRLRATFPDDPDRCRRCEEVDEALAYFSSPKTGSRHRRVDMLVPCSRRPHSS
jgi:hypothetical protein